MLLACIVAATIATGSPASVLSLPSYCLSVDAQALWMDSLSSCESEGSTTIRILDTNDHYSYGKYQYQMSTWLDYSFLGATSSDIYNGDLQDTITRYILDTNGYRGYWDICGAVVTKKYGAYPLYAGP